MRTRRIQQFLGLVLGVLIVSASAQAAGKGQSKIDFQFKTGDAASSRLFIKRMVDQAVINQIPEVGSKSKNDNLAGQTITLQLGSDSASAISGVADDKGKVTTPFDFKITGNGKGLQLKANGLDLATLLGITQTADGEYKVDVLVKITASRTDAATNSTTIVELANSTVKFEYKIKNGAVKGRGF
ncbi:MAG TPA: hypothetical protein VEK08_25365 [Planctomycetota bacterium]|nr:hypothetical protein [Planctomycetota bacterium]